MTGEIVISWGEDARFYRLGDRGSMSGFADRTALYYRVYEIQFAQNKLLVEMSEKPPTRWQRFIDWWSTDLLQS